MAVRFRVRTLAVLLAAITVASSPSAFAQQSTLPRSYALAIKCFVANGYARNLRRQAGDAAGADRYDRLARQSLESASTFGVALGYDQRRIEADMNSAMGRELPLMTRDQAYMRQAVADCRGVGLM